MGGCTWLGWWLAFGWRSFTGVLPQEKDKLVKHVGYQKGTKVQNLGNYIAISTILVYDMKNQNTSAKHEQAQAGHLATDPEPKKKRGHQKGKTPKRQETTLAKKFLTWAFSLL